MTDEQAAIIKYRLERAHEALEEAALLFSNGYDNSYVNRLYFACFYAGHALLRQNRVSATMHAMTPTQFAKYFVHTGLVDKETGEFYSKLFRYRQESDYKDYYVIDHDLAAPWMEQARAFVATIEQLITSGG